MSCRCYRSLTLPRGAMGWSVVCDCGISSVVYMHNGCMMDIWVGGWVDECVDGRVDALMYVCKVGWVDGWMDGWMAE